MSDYVKKINSKIVMRLYVLWKYGITCISTAFVLLNLIVCTRKKNVKEYDRDLVTNKKIILKILKRNDKNKINVRIC